LIIGPFAGVVADRYDRRRIMLFADLSSTAVLGGFLALLVANGRPPLWSLFMTPFLLSSVKSCFLPAKSASIASLVPADTLLEATALSQATHNLMLTCGLLMAGVFLGPFERADPRNFFATAVTVNLVTFLVSAWFVRLLPPLVPGRSERHETHPLTDLKEGIKVVARHRVLAPLFATNLVVYLCIAGFIVVYTATNRAWFDGSFQGLALLEVSFVAAMVVASLALPRFKVVKVGWSYAIGTFLLGGTVAMLAFSRAYPLFVMWNVAAGICIPFMSIPMATYTNLAVTDEFRGRVNSFATMVSAGVQPVGSALTGVFLNSLGIVGMYLAMGMGMSVAGVAPLVSKAFRDAENPRPAT
jgi:DHA3 family macrolide efflux protein-like MFS transporter